MSTVWFVEGKWWTGNSFGTGECESYAEALRDFRRMRNNRAVQSVKLIREKRTRTVVRKAKKVKQP